jgi:ADP-heptose:LPS heptosyltransferase
MGIVKASDYFLGCDSMGQHYAHALGKPATVIIGSTFPQNISYTNTKNFTIIDNGKDKGRIYNPFRITMDFDSERDN